MNGTTSGDLSAVLGALRRRLGVIVLVFVLTVAAAFAFAKLQPEQYQAKATLLFRVTGLESQVAGQAPPPLTDAERQGQTNVALVSLDVIKRRTAAKLGRPALPGEVVAEPEGQSDLVSVTATAEDPELAARIANVFSSEFVSFRRATAREQLADAERNARRELGELSGASENRRRAIEENLQSLQLARSVQTGNVELVQRAVPPAAAFSPQVGRILLIGAFLGLILGLAVALLVEQLDRRVRRASELPGLIGVPVLATVPRASALRGRRRRGGRNHDGGPGATGHLERLSGLEAEAFRGLHVNLRHSEFGREIRSVAVTSPSAGTGKTTVSLQLAAAAAETGRRVLVIEADTRRPAMAEGLGLDGGTEGLTAFLRDPHTLEGRIHPVEVTGDEGSTAGFDVVLAGGSLGNPSHLLDSAQMADVLSVTRRAYDLVIIDLPPFEAPEVVPVVKLVDGVLIVSRVGDDTRESSQRIRSELDRLGVEPLGVVANFSAPVEGAYVYEAAQPSG